MPTGNFIPLEACLPAAVAESPCCTVGECHLLAGALHIFLLVWISSQTGSTEGTKHVGFLFVSPFWKSCMEILFWISASQKTLSILAVLGETVMVRHEHWWCYRTGIHADSVLGLTLSLDLVLFRFAKSAPLFSVLSFHIWKTTRIQTIIRTSLPSGQLLHVMEAHGPLWDREDDTDCHQ